MKKTALIVAGLLTTISSMAASQDARKILEVSGVQGGLVVVIGCDSPELLAHYRRNGMLADFSCDGTARRYVKLYLQA